jgi:hypothetical protein
VQFGDKRRSSDAGEEVPGDHQAKAVREPGLLDQAQRFRGVGGPKDIRESFFQD